MPGMFNVGAGAEPISQEDNAPASNFLYGDEYRLLSVSTVSHAPVQAPAAAS